MIHLDDRLSTKVFILLFCWRFFYFLQHFWIEPQLKLLAIRKKNFIQKAYPSDGQQDLPIKM